MTGEACRRVGEGEREGGTKGGKVCATTCVQAAQLIIVPLPTRSSSHLVQCHLRRNTLAALWQSVLQRVMRVGRCLQRLPDARSSERAAVHVIHSDSGSVDRQRLKAVSRFCAAQEVQATAETQRTDSWPHAPWCRDRER
jgi:hypothetical protein